MLKAGARVAIVAPGGAVSSETLRSPIACLVEWGFEPVLAPHLYDRHRYLAGTPSDRAADLEWALTAPNIDAVYCARGGYGAAQLLDAIPWEHLEPRLLIGFSDVTALLCVLARHGIHSIHGPVLSMLAGNPQSVDAESRDALRRLLTAGASIPLHGEPLCGPRNPVCGRLLGGNLTVLASLAGTPHQLRAADAIVVLEDVGEKLYRIERALCQMIDSGGFAGARGFALGDFIGCEERDGDSYRLRDLWLERLGPLGVPVVHRIPVGHGERNLPFRYGAEFELTGGGLHVVEE